MRRTNILYLLALVAPAAWASLARAEILVLTDGKIIEGDLTDRGEQVEVRTRFGTLAIARSDVKKIVKSPAQALADAETVQKLAREVHKEAIALPAGRERQQKLAAGIEFLKKASAACRETREVVFPDPVHASMDKVLAELDAEVRRLRDEAGEEPTILPPIPPPVMTPPRPIPLAPAPEAPAPHAGVTPPAAPSKPVPPSPEDQKQAESLIRGIFKADYAKRASSDLTALARKLIQQGLETKDDAIARFVLFREGRDLAGQAGDAGTALRAVEAMDRFYAIDPIAEKSAALGKADAAAKTPEAARALADQYVRLANEAEGANQYDAASRLAARAEAAAARANDASLAARIRDRLKEIQEIQKESAALAGHRKSLTSNPDDAAANAAVGRFLCLTRGHWDQGLPMLAKGADPVLKALAGKELAGPVETADQLALADAWWDAGEKQAMPAKARYLERAVHWYGAAAPNATGLSQAKIKARMEAFDKLAPQRTASAGLQPLQGFGTTTRAGMGQPVVRVTTLADHGPGSLRDALLKGNRTIVFDVAGEIPLANSIHLGGAFVTIDGTTAPVPGITLKSHGLDIRTDSVHDVVVRGLRFRDGGGIAVWRGAHTVVIDHVSVHKPASDALLVSRDAHDVTVSWSIFGESEGRSSVASVVDSVNVTLHHNLFVRSPRTVVSVGGSYETPAEAKGSKPRPASPSFNLDFRNNVVWGWATERGAGIHLSLGAVANVVSNLFGAGGVHKDAAMTAYSSRATTVKIFAAGNVSTDPSAKDPNAVSTEKAAMPAAVVTTAEAPAAARDVLAGAGARPLDAADRELIRTILLPARR